MTKYRRLPEVFDVTPHTPGEHQPGLVWAVQLTYRTTRPTSAPCHYKVYVSDEELKTMYEPVPERAPLAFFFGCVGTAGHWLHDRHQRHLPYGTTPWGTALDRGSCKSTTCRCKSRWLRHGRIEMRMLPNIMEAGQKEGEALLHHMEGFTAVCFWDRSIDTRGGSCAAFIAEGTLGFRQVLDVARETFPSILARFKFDIVEVAE